MGFGPVRVMIQVTLHNVVSGVQTENAVHALRVAVIHFLMQGVRRDQCEITRAKLNAFRTVWPKNDSSVAARRVDDLKRHYQSEVSAISSDLYSLIGSCVAQLVCAIVAN